MLFIRPVLLRRVDPRAPRNELPNLSILIGLYRFFVRRAPISGAPIRLFGGMNLTDLSTLERVAQNGGVRPPSRFLLQNGGTCAVTSSWKEAPLGSINRF
jgi:hypothetical protein